MAVRVIERAQHLIQRAVETAFVGLGDHAGAPPACEGREVGSIAVEQPLGVADGRIVGAGVQCGALRGPVGHVDARGKHAIARIGH